MPVVVHPDTFSTVFFDAAEIQALADELVGEVGLAPDLSVRVEVDETTPLGRVSVRSMEPVVLLLESGALEDAKRPRQLDPVATADVIGRLLLQVRDRLDPAFGPAPLDDELPLPESVAWEVYCVGRLGRLGRPVQRQRRLYQFRNRHGFTDASDAAFDRLWNAEGLTWTDITDISAEVRAARLA
ncbi:MAG: hypothetical protein ABWZ76_13400 [Acidimicrobiales bacterium]